MTLNDFVAEQLNEGGYNNRGEVVARACGF